MPDIVVEKVAHQDVVQSIKGMIDTKQVLKADFGDADQGCKFDNIDATQTQSLSFWKIRATNPMW